MLSIGIIGGCGTIGGALKRWFEEHTRHSLAIYDPPRNKKDSLQGCDVTFICVPAPTNEDGSQDLSYIDDAMTNARGKIFIRSTVIPGTNDKYGTFSCPEFLTQSTAYEDMCRMGIVSGCKDFDLMHEIFPGKQLHLMSNVEAEISKYAHNCFGAVKVNFFNLIHNLCELRGADYNRVLNGILMSGYINQTHTRCPGNRGEFGYSGACYPKDIKAFNHFYPTDTFKACINENKIHRKNYND